MAFSTQIITPFLTLLFLLLVGVALRRWRWVTHDAARQMTGLVLNVTLPPLIFVTLATELTPAELARAPLLVVMGVVGPLIGYGVAALMARLSLFARKQRSTLLAAVGMLNTTFVGYPVCQGLLGDKGLLYAVLYDAGFSLLMSTFCIWLMSWQTHRGRASWSASLRDLAQSPLMWAVVLGLIWGAAGWPMPVWVRQPLSTLGQATTPLALLTVGLLVRPAETDQGTFARRGRAAFRLALLAVARLAVTPLLVWVLVRLFRIEVDAAAVIVLQTAMPTAVATTAMAEQYGGDSSFAAAAVVLTTFLSLLTLPMWSWIVL